MRTLWPATKINAGELCSGQTHLAQAESPGLGRESGLLTADLQPLAWPEVAQ